MNVSEMRGYCSAEDTETLEFINVFLMYFHWKAIWGSPTEK